MRSVVSGSLITSRITATWPLSHLSSSTSSAMLLTSRPSNCSSASSSSASVSPRTSILKKNWRSCAASRVQAFDAARLARGVGKDPRLVGELGKALQPRRHAHLQSDGQQLLELPGAVRRTAGTAGEGGMRGAATSRSSSHHRRNRLRHLAPGAQQPVAACRTGADPCRSGSARAPVRPSCAPGCRRSGAPRGCATTRAAVRPSPASHRCPAPLAIATSCAENAVRSPSSSRRVSRVSGMSGRVGLGGLAQLVAQALLGRVALRARCPAISW